MESKPAANARAVTTVVRDNLHICVTCRVASVAPGDEPDRTTRAAIGDGVARMSRLRRMSWSEQRFAEALDQ